jgi:hypothetical protein
MNRAKGEQLSRRRESQSRSWRKADYGFCATDKRSAITDWERLPTQPLAGGGETSGIYTGLAPAAPEVTD